MLMDQNWRYRLDRFRFSQKWDNLSLQAFAVRWLSARGSVCFETEEWRVWSFGKQESIPVRIRSRANGPRPRSMHRYDESIPRSNES